MADDADVRVSDGERHRAVEALRAAFADDRLSVDELEERLGEAFAARTRGELAASLRGLPSAELPPPALPLSVTQLAKRLSAPRRRSGGR